MSTEKAAATRVAVVTGAAMGIGASVAELLVKRGHTVVVADIADQVGQEFTKHLNTLGGPVVYVHTDVTRSADCQNLIETAVQKFGRLDWLVNNAGISLAKSTMDTSEEEWDRLFSIDLKGTWMCSKFAIPYLAKNKGSAIVNMTSDAGIVGFTNLAAYCAAKGGIIQLTKACALDVADMGIRVNAVAPGHTRTPGGMGFINTQKDPARFEIEHVNKNHPIGRMGEPEEVAEATYFLLSEAASYITGAVLSVDGGYTTR